MTPRFASRAAALLIGDELLKGRVVEANLHGLAQTLNALGVELGRVVMVGDHVETIARDMASLSTEFDLVVTSGGVGPTHDDVTLEAVALAFATEIVEDPSTVQLLIKAYGRPLSPAHLRLARVPKGAQLATTADVEWPAIVFGNVWLFPGVPEIFRMKLDVLRAWVRGPGASHSRAVFTRVEEAALTPLLDRVVTRHREVAVGSYPKWFNESYKTKVTFDARDPAAVEVALEEFLAGLPEGAVVHLE